MQEKMVYANSVNNKKTLLGYELSPRQDALVNYLVPSICACLLYTFIIAGDIAVIFSHYKNEDPIWASLTLFIMYLPSLGSYIIIISNWELWPEYEGCGIQNIKWFIAKTIEHLLFPVWSMWRFAERIFWSIEAVRADDKSTVAEAKNCANVPRSIELYVFLQSYLHALPQVLLQLYILMRHNTDINMQTREAQIVSIVFNLAKVSVTTTYYQRFKAQKLTGKQYPWYKSYKVAPPSSVELRSSTFHQSRSILGRGNTMNIEEVYDLEPSRLAKHRRSSDIYLEPSTSTSSNQDKRQTFLETEDTQLAELRRTSDNNLRDLQKTSPLKQTVVDELNPGVLRETGISGKSEPDFNISRIIYVKGLQDDDLAGKLIAFFWWFGFLLARALAISVFAYFFARETIWLLCSHFLIVMAFLLYDVKSNEVKRAKAIFFLFIGLIYIFCIIEFKIKFKKATFIYYGFFVLVFFENFLMCIIWFVDRIESIENDFWFRYTFYIIVMCSLTSFSSMVFYFNINKPSKVVIETNTNIQR